MTRNQIRRCSSVEAASFTASSRKRLRSSAAGFFRSTSGAVRTWSSSQPSSRRLRAPAASESLALKNRGFDDIKDVEPGELIHVRPEGYTKSAWLSSELREFPATAISILDLVRGEKPTFLGEALPIFAEGR